MNKGLERVPRRSQRCAGCERHFSPRERLHSVIANGERRDYCRDCWGEASANESESRWSGRIPERPAHEEPPLTGEERLLLLLQEAIQEKGREERALLLALYLERRGVIERVKTGRAAIEYKARRSEALFKVRRVGLETLPKEASALLVQELEGRYAHPS